MITNKQLSQGVSIIPVLVSVIVLIFGGSWFIAYESYTYTASDDIVDGLVKNSDYIFYLDDVENSQYDGVDKTGNCLTHRRADHFETVEKINEKYGSETAMAAAQRYRE